MCPVLFHRITELKSHPLFKHFNPLSPQPHHTVEFISSENIFLSDGAVEASAYFNKDKIIIEDNVLVAQPPFILVITE